MIDFRYHVVSIIAVFLALALGLFVGSTSLQDAVVHTISTKADSVKRANDSLSSQVHALQGQVSANEKFDKALLPYAVTGRLSGQLVSVISAPGTSDSVRKQVIAAVDAAGGTVSADVRLQTAITDPKQDAFLSGLAERVSIPGHPADASSDGAQRAAKQLAAVLGVRPTSHAVAAATIDTVLSAYSTGKLLSLGGEVATQRPGTLAIILTGPAPSPAADPNVVKA
ncbi:MAG TPA: copper transporter, partial [Mycobacteriales bacterium]|nr:copper transporter [Mycobacteriales bacterium]